MFDFLTQISGFDIGETGLLSFDASQPLWRALLVGLGNTLRTCLPALVLSTALGLVLAMARRSNDIAFRRMALWIIEGIRNVPLLVQLLMIYFLLLNALPDPHEPWHLLPGIWLSKGGLNFPWPNAWLDSQDVTQPGDWFSWPEPGAFNVSGGAALTPEYLAITCSLTLYTAAFLAEVFRGGFDALSPTYGEAANTLGATRWQTWSRVVLPMALRGILPAAANQYINLLKNASLGVAVGYPDLVSVTQTAANQSGKTFACLTVMLACYVFLSLVTSAFMNWLNARVSHGATV